MESKKEDKKQEILKMLAVLAAGYPDVEIGEETVKLYLVMLSDIPLDLLKAALMELIAKSKWFPKVADIRDAVYRLIAKKDGIPQPFEAWGQVVAEMKQKGITARPDFTHPFIMETVNAVGGWYYLCHSENSVSDRARFLEFYEQKLRQHRDDALSLPGVEKLLGRLESGENLKLSGGKDG